MTEAEIAAQNIRASNIELLLDLVSIVGFVMVCVMIGVVIWFYRDKMKK